MPTADHWCANCASYTEGEVACGRCGQIRLVPVRRETPSTVRPSPANILGGIVGGIFLAVPTYVFWGVFNQAMMSSLGGDPPWRCGSEHLFAVYATSATRAYAVGLAVVTLLLCGLAIVVAVRLTRARKPGVAIALLLVTFVGLVPATACDASAFYTCR